MMKKNVKHYIDGLAALLLFGIFAVCILAVLLTGAGAYERLTARDQAAYDHRVCTQYIATRVRQADLLGNVSVEEFGGVPALCLVDAYGYMTRVYCYDGYLKELYASADADLSPEAGEDLMEAKKMTFALEDGLLTILVTGPDGTEEQMYLSLRCRKEAAA